MKTILAFLTLTACGYFIASPVLKPIGESLNKITKTIEPKRIIHVD